MQRFALPLLLALFAACAGNDHDTSDASTPGGSGPNGEMAALNTGAYRYDVKSGMIRYWNGSAGRFQEFYFDDYGARQALYDEPRENDTSLPTTVVITTDTSTIRYDVRTRQGMIVHHEPTTRALLGSVPPVWKMEDKELDLWEARRRERKPVLGKQSEGWSYREGIDASVWVWKGIPLQIQQLPKNREEVIMAEARAMQIDIAIPPQRFRVPSDVKIIEDTTRVAEGGSGKRN